MKQTHQPRIALMDSRRRFSLVGVFVSTMQKFGSGTKDLIASAQL
jgi:hypothetical protein